MHVRKLLATFIIGAVYNMSRHTQAGTNRRCNTLLSPRGGCALQIIVISPLLRNLHIQLSVTRPSRHISSRAHSRQRRLQTRHHTHREYPRSMKQIFHLFFTPSALSHCVNRYVKLFSCNLQCADTYYSMLSLNCVNFFATVRLHEILTISSLSISSCLVLKFEMRYSR